MLALQLDCAEQIQFGEDRPGQTGLEYGLRHVGLAVLVVRCQEKECLGKA